MAASLAPTRAVSSRRQNVLTAIRQHFRETGQSPSYREIASRSAMRPRHVRRILDQLAADELIRFAPGRPRSIELVDRGAGLSDLELEVACHERGWTVTHPPAGVPIAAGFPAEHRPMAGADALLARLGDVPGV